MRNITLFISLFTFTFVSTAQNIYEDALSHADYAYSHSKNAHESNNVHHVYEHADKAIEAFIKVADLADSCGCEDAYNTALDARESAESALDQDTFERSRFYAKRARTQGEQMVILLNDCQPKGVSSSQYATSEIDHQKEELVAEQAYLLAQQKALAAEQARLNSKIEEQKRKAVELETVRIAELEKQTALKSKAESALKNLETALKELSLVFNADLAVDDYTRGHHELKEETLDDTRYFYAIKASEIAKLAMDHFNESAQ